MIDVTFDNAIEEVVIATNNASVDVTRIAGSSLKKILLDVPKSLIIKNFCDIVASGGTSV